MEKYLLLTLAGIRDKHGQTFQFRASHLHPSPPPPILELALSKLCNLNAGVRIKTNDNKKKKQQFLLWQSKVSRGSGCCIVNHTDDSRWLAQARLDCKYCKLSGAERFLLYRKLDELGRLGSGRHVLMAPEHKE